MRSHKEIIETFPGVVSRSQVRRIRKTPEWQLGNVIGSIPAGSVHYCHNRTHLTDVVKGLMIPWMVEIKDAGGDIESFTVIKKAFDAHQRIAIGWFDAGRQYPKEITVEAIFEQMTEELKNEHDTGQRD